MGPRGRPVSAATARVPATVLTMRLESIRVSLDQCWDLLRQRRALREAGYDPEAARVRDPEVVERYEQ